MDSSLRINRCWIWAWWESITSAWKKITISERICGKTNVMWTWGYFPLGRAAEEHCDGSDNEEDWLDLGIDTKEEMDAAMEKLLEKSKRCWLEPKKEEQKLKNPTSENTEIYFACAWEMTHQQSGPNESGLKIWHNTRHMQTEAILTRATWFMKRYISKLHEYGFIEPNPNDVQLRTSEHRSMYSYVRLSIDRCTATYVWASIDDSTTSEHRSMYSYVRLSIDRDQLRVEQTCTQ